MDIENIVSAQREYFLSGQTLDVQFRLDALRRLKAATENNCGSITGAIASDLGRSETEAHITEIGLILHEINYYIKNLKKWAKKKRVRSTLALFPARCYRVPEPYGVALIMSPWNYPYLLSVQPLISAIAAGNCAVVKTSAYSPAVADVVAGIVGGCFDPRHAAVVRGSRAENQMLLNQKFDYIFFTGGAAAGRYVMECAAKHLTPVTLELGGKSPVIVDQTAKIDLAAKRLVFGKFINAGQTCVAPDYVLVHESKRSELLAALEKYIDIFYPKGADGKIADYPKMINQKHFSRVLGLIESEEKYCGGGYDAQSLKIEPTVLANVSFNSPVMGEEIFGPVLPVISYKDLNETLDMLKRRPRPLAMYVFSEDKAVWDKVERTVPFGGGAINDCIVQLASHRLPFGGVGESGMGSYHGKTGFDTFTHYKSMLNKSTKIDISARYRPYDEKKSKFLKGH